MAKTVSYSLNEAVATITMDDGKVNCLSLQALSELNDAFDLAESVGATVVLTGREGCFSAGFDLSVLRAGGRPAFKMLRAGFELAERMLSFPTPIVIACNGHAVAMGAFLLLSADVRIGASGPFKFTANEVAIGLTVPYAALVILRHRLTPAHFNRAAVLAEVFSPEDGLAAGFLDRLVPAGQLLEAVHETTAMLMNLDMPSHAATKLRAREQLLESLREGIAADAAGWEKSYVASP